MRECKGWCNRYKSESLTKPIYENHKRCTLCEVYYPNTILKCPCCKCILRSRAYNRISRMKQTVKFNYV